MLFFFNTQCCTIAKSAKVAGEEEVDRCDSGPQFLGVQESNPYEFLCYFFM